MTDGYPPMILRAASTFAYRRPSTPQVSAPIQNFLSERIENERMDLAPFQIPHDAKRSKGGEDTYFIARDGAAFGVFDGVGGWAEEGIDPRQYAYVLSRGCEAAAGNAALTPVEILTEGYDKATTTLGSCTACVGTISESGVLDVANVGDSGFMVIRDSKIILRSIEQQHVFNMPFQLGTASSDHPHHSDKYSLKLEQGDVVIFGTDGLFDNLFDDAIQSIVQRNLDKSSQDIARLVAREAYEIGKSNNVITPFGEVQPTIARDHGAQGQRAGWGRGEGKPDDITVLVVKYHGHGTGEATQQRAKL